MSIDLTIITATCRRYAQLACQIKRVQAMSQGGLSVEHLIVVDDPLDQVSFAVADMLRVRAVASKYTPGYFGAAAKQTGIGLAQGAYITCWDDDDFYEPHAIVVAYASVHGTDIGICQMRHVRPADTPPWEQLVPNPGKAPIQNRFNGGSMTVRRELAQAVPIFDGNGERCTDWRWYERLRAAGGQERVLPVTIGMLIDTYYPKADEPGPRRWYDEKSHS